jgi:hypothetical protein
MPADKVLSFRLRRGVEFRQREAEDMITLCFCYIAVAWFTFDPCLGPPELQFSEDNCTVSCEGYEHRVALGSVGFSRGVHYWEFSINRYDSDTDPSFGIARLDVAKDQMLGKNCNGAGQVFGLTMLTFFGCKDC